MMTTTTLSKQGGRRYPQMNGIAGTQLQRFTSRGTTTTTVVGGNNAPISIDLPELNANMPGTVVLGGGGLN